ncbi:MAG: HD domain-containing protein [Candidatus Obscuribacterales bacterium]
MGVQDPDVTVIFAALRFAALKHKEQRRKDSKTPYINHPIEVAELLLRVGRETETETVVAALLHDTIEDTNTTAEEIQALFGEKVAGLVKECTDDKSLPKEVRKELQVEHAPHKSEAAKKIKLADKISNVKDVIFTPPPDWSLQRKMEYLTWSERVVEGLRGCSPGLESLYDNVLAEGKNVLKSQQDKVAR